MRRVLLLATGDVIAYRRGAKPGLADAAGLLRAVPPGELAADVTAEDILAEPSWDRSPETMLRLARRVRSAIVDDGFDGVVLTHGFDTMEDGAYLVDLMAGPAAARGGIVLTGAVRPLDDLSSDGPRNLAASIAAAASPALRGAGAVVCANDELHAARWVSMVDSTGVAAFSSAPDAMLGRVVDGQVELLAAPPPRPPAAAGEPESSVALVKTYPGIEPVLLTAAADAGAQGIVLEVTGAGNVPVGLLSTIGELTDWGIPVVVASRCRTREAPLEELGLGAEIAAKVGAIGARDLPPAKARCALMVALGSRSPAAARAWFAQLP